MNIRRLGLLAATALVVVGVQLQHHRGGVGRHRRPGGHILRRRRRNRGRWTPPSGDAPGVGSTKVGFIFVGPKDDFGYNQAAYAGSQAVAEAHPDLEVLTAENVPEDDNATRVMEKMVDDGAKIIFATSYGHLDPAMKIAAEHPDVVVVQQGNVISGTVPPNAGTYFGTVYEPVYLAGIAAGSVDRVRTSSATSTPSRSPRRSPTSTPSSSAPSRSTPTPRRTSSTRRTGATRPSRPRPPAA